MVPAKSWQKPVLLEDGFPSFSERAVFALQHIIDNNSRIVLTTSHKEKYSIGEWKEIFNARGVNISNLECLSANDSHLSRKDEIVNWTLSNTIQGEFVILDDDKSLNELPGFLKSHLILTSSFIGLTEEHIGMVNQIKNSSPEFP